MALSTLAMVTLALSGVSASAPKHAPKHAPEPAPDQLETARLPQAAQRLEFGVEGDASAFKFAFADPVCHLSSHMCPKHTLPKILISVCLVAIRSGVSRSLQCFLVFHCIA